MAVHSTEDEPGDVVCSAEGEEEMSKIDQTTGRRDGVTCYEQDEQLCTDPMCKPGRLRNEIIEQCAKAVEARIIQEDELTIVDYETIACASAVRALKDE